MQLENDAWIFIEDNIVEYNIFDVVFFHFETTSFRLFLVISYRHFLGSNILHSFYVYWIAQNIKRAKVNSVLSSMALKWNEALNNENDIVVATERHLLQGSWLTESSQRIAA